MELLVVLTIVAAMSSYALPAFSHWVKVLQVQADQRVLIGMINATRLSAVRLNARVTLCPGDETGCGGRNTWHRGVIMFADANNNRRIDDNETLIAHLPEMYSHTTWRSFRNRSYLRFLPNGFTDWQNGHFKLCPPADSATQAPTLYRMLVLNYSGRLYPSNDSDGDGVHEDVQGEPLEC